MDAIQEEAESNREIVLGFVLFVQRPERILSGDRKHVHGNLHENCVRRFGRGEL